MGEWSLRVVPDPLVGRFPLAPPRRFIFPAILLLLSERPGYGYRLTTRLGEFCFDQVDRPGVYRALSQLEQDGLIQSSSATSAFGRARRYYAVTPLGNEVLRLWMQVIEREHENLATVIGRYASTKESVSVDRSDEVQRRELS